MHTLPAHLAGRADEQKAVARGRLLTAIETLYEKHDTYDRMMREAEDYAKQHLDPLVSEIIELQQATGDDKIAVGDCQIVFTQKSVATYDTSSTNEKLDIAKALGISKEAAPDKRGLTKHISSLAEQAEMAGETFVPPPGVLWEEKTTVAFKGLPLRTRIRKRFDPDAE